MVGVAVDLLGGLPGVLSVALWIMQLFVAIVLCGCRSVSFIARNPGMGCVAWGALFNPSFLDWFKVGM